MKMKNFLHSFIPQLKPCLLKKLLAVDCGLLQILDLNVLAIYKRVQVICPALSCAL